MTIACPILVSSLGALRERLRRYSYGCGRTLKTAERRDNLNVRSELELLGVSSRGNGPLAGAPGLTIDPSNSHVVTLRSTERFLGLLASTAIGVSPLRLLGVNSSDDTSVCTACPVSGGGWTLSDVSHLVVGHRLTAVLVGLLGSGHRQSSGLTTIYTARDDTILTGCLAPRRSRCQYTRDRGCRIGEFAIA